MTAVESFYIQGIQRPLSGWNVVREEVRDNASGAVTGVYDYYWGRDLSGSLQGADGVGGLLAYTHNGALRIPVYDHIGNVVAVVDESGTTVAAYEYDPFGNIVSQFGSEADEVPFRFSTKYFDHETGLYYYGYRFYVPTMGRWMNKDPIEERGGVGLYSFCKNASMSLTDKLGLIWKITRNATNNWAAAEATDSSDTFDSLARTLHFDPAEIEKWSNGTILLGPTPRIGCKYSIPNVYVFFTSSRKWTDITLVVTLHQHKVKEMAVISALSGFKTKVYFNSSNRNDFIQAWNINGLAGFFFAGHGNGAGMILQKSPEISVFPDEVSPKYKLSIGHFYACDSKHSSMIFGRWQNYVAIEAGGILKVFLAMHICGQT